MSKKLFKNSSPLFIDIGQGLSMMIGLPTIASWDTDSRPKKPKPGIFGFNYQTNSLEYWDGTSWYTANLS